MKNISKRMKILALTSVSALTLSGLAFVSSAFADETATPSPTESASNPGSSGESETPEEAEVVEPEEVAEPEEVDTEVAEIDAENQAEGDAFNQDAAEAGDAEDAAALTQAGAEVTSVTAPEAAGAAADNHLANGIINGTTTPLTPTPTP